MKGFQWKHILVFIYLFAVSFSATNYVAALQPHPLVVAMEASGGKMKEYGVHGWAKVSDTKFQEASLEELAVKGMEEVGFDREHCQLIRHTAAKQELVIATAQGETGKWTVMAERIHSENPKVNGLYMVMEVEGQTENPGIFRVEQKKLEKIIRHFTPLPRINTCLTGYLDGKLSDGECQNILQKAFDGAGGVIIDQLIKGDFYSYTGFSPSITEFLQIGATRMNLNVAMRYSQYDNRTYILIGSPVITREY